LRSTSAAEPSPVRTAAIRRTDALTNANRRTIADFQLWTRKRADLFFGFLLHGLVLLFFN